MAVGDARVSQEVVEVLISTENPEDPGAGSAEAQVQVVIVG